MRSLYQILSRGAETQEILTWIEDVTRERGIDLSDFEIQQSTNSRVYAVPASSTAIIGTEKVGDIAADTSFLYVVVDNAGVLRWQRVATATF